MIEHGHWRAEEALRETRRSANHVAYQLVELMVTNKRLQIDVRDHGRPISELRWLQQLREVDHVSPTPIDWSALMQDIKRKQRSMLALPIECRVCHQSLRVYFDGVDTLYVGNARCTMTPRGPGLSQP